MLLEGIVAARVTSFVSSSSIIWTLVVTFLSEMSVTARRTSRELKSREWIRVNEGLKNGSGYLKQIIMRTLTIHKHMLASKTSKRRYLPRLLNVPILACLSTNLPGLHSYVRPICGG
jgi:hypothetical protein